MKYFLIPLLTFLQIPLYIFKQFIIFYKKDIYLVSSKPLLYTWRCNFFIIFVTNKTFNAERNLIRYGYFINIYIVYRNRALLLVKFMFFHFSITKLLIICLTIIIYALILFLIFTVYNVPLFSLKLVFCINFMTSRLLIPPIIQP